MVKEIIFDMDGTIVNFYKYPNWLEKLRSYNVTPYREAEPLYDTTILNSLVRSLQRNGYEIKVVTALSKGCTNKEYNYRVTKEKQKWLERYGFPYTSFFAVPYEEPKSNYLEGESILIDDDPKVREEFSAAGGKVIDANKNILTELAKLLIEE